MCGIAIGFDALNVRLVSLSGSLLSVLMLGAAVSMASCGENTRMCSSADVCRGTSACVAGRCLPPEDAGTPRVAKSQRFTFQLAKSRPDDPEAFARGEVRLSSKYGWSLDYLLPQALHGMHLVEAYLLLHPLARPTQSSIVLHAQDGADRSLFPDSAGAIVHLDPPSLGTFGHARVDVHRAVTRALSDKALQEQSLSKLTLTLAAEAEGDGIIFASTGEDEPLLEIYVTPTKD